MNHDISGDEAGQANFWGRHIKPRLITFCYARPAIAKARSSVVPSA